VHPEHPDAQYGLASALLRLGRTDQAAPHLEAFNRLARQRAEALRSNYELFGLKRQATFHEDEGRYEDAVAAWRAVVDREPEHAENHLALGEALVAAGHVDLGIRSLERAAALQVAGDVYRRLAELYAARGLGEQSARAQAEYERRQADAFRRRTSGH
jgi:predicted Zn-dependent protease